MGAVLAGRVQAKVAVDELMGRRQRLESDARGDADEPRLGV
jgi:hypothetical protein